MQVIFGLPPAWLQLRNWQEHCGVTLSSMDSPCSASRGRRFKCALGEHLGACPPFPGSLNLQASISYRPQGCQFLHSPSSTTPRQGWALPGACPSSGEEHWQSASCGSLCKWWAWGGACRVTEQISEDTLNQETKRYFWFWTMCWLALNRGGFCVSMFLSGRRENCFLVVGITFSFLLVRLRSERTWRGYSAASPHSGLLCPQRALVWKLAEMEEAGWSCQ